MNSCLPSCDLSDPNSSFLGRNEPLLLFWQKQASNSLRLSSSWEEMEVTRLGHMGAGLVGRENSHSDLVRSFHGFILEWSSWEKFIFALLSDKEVSAEEIQQMEELITYIRAQQSQMQHSSNVSYLWLCKIIPVSAFLLYFYNCCDKNAFRLTG